MALKTQIFEGNNYKTSVKPKENFPLSYRYSPAIHQRDPAAATAAGRSPTTIFTSKHAATPSSAAE